VGCHPTFTGLRRGRRIVLARVDGLSRRGLEAVVQRDVVAGVIPRAADLRVANGSLPRKEFETSTSSALILPLSFGGH